MEKTLFAQEGEIRGKKKTGKVSVAYQYTPEDDHLKQIRGMLFIFIEIEVSDEQKGLDVGKEIFETLKSKFYETAGGNLKALEETIDFLKEENKKRGLLVDVLIANLWGSVVYLAKLGSGDFFLSREKVVKNLGISKIASGALRDKDTLILANTDFTTNLPLEELGGITTKENFDDILGEFKNKLGEKEGNGICIRLTVQEPVETKEPPIKVDFDRPKVQDKDLQKEIDLVPTEEKKIEGVVNRFKRTFRAYWQKIRPKVQAYGFSKELIRKGTIILLSPWVPRTIGSTDSLEVRKQKRIIQVVVVLGFFLVVSIGFGLWNHNRNVNRETFENSIASVENKIEDAENVKNVSPSEAAILLGEAEEELKKLDTNDEKVKSLNKKIENLLAQINKIFRIKLQEMVDLTAIKGGVETAKITLEGKNIFILDTGTGSIYKVNISSKESEILLSEKGDLQNIATSGDFLYVQTKSGILQIDIETGSETKVADASSDWKTLIEAATYRENLYLLDKKVRQIWKAVPVSGGLSNPSGYFQDQFTEEPQSFAVDGSVWVATKTKILKYFGGKQAEFTVKNQPVAFKGITNLFTKEGLANLYVLDKDGGGVFVIKKDTGEYLGFYRAVDLESAKGVAVDEANKNIYVLKGEEIKTFKIR